MKPVIFAVVFAILAAASSLADGLKITEVRYYVDYDEAYTYSLEEHDHSHSGYAVPSNGSKIDADIFPGSNVSFTVTVENTFPSGGLDIKGVFTRMILEEVDDGGDLEEESLDFDLEPGDDYRYDIKFEIPLDVESGTYDAVLEAEGEDKNGTEQNTRITLKLEVKRQNHDIRITRASIEPGIIQCDRKIKLSADAMNLGSNPENQVSLEFKSLALGISSIDKDISLESSDQSSIDDRTYTKDATLQIPNSVKSGTYLVDVNLYWKDIALFDKKTLNLKVNDCGSQQPSEGAGEVEILQPGSGNSGVQDGQPSGQQIYGGNGGIIASVTASPSLVVIILGAFIAFVLAIVAIFGYARKP